VILKCLVSDQLPDYKIIVLTFLGHSFNFMLALEGHGEA